MAAYLITGPNGSGKSTVGKAIARLGNNIIEMDFEPGLSGWASKTGEKITDLPPQPYQKS